MSVRPKGKRASTRLRGPRIVVVGLGRLGGALALSISRAGLPVSVLPRSGDSDRKVKKLGLKVAGPQELLKAEVCLVAVPDSAVGLLALRLHGQLGPKAALVHCAGALDLSAFGSSAEILRRRRGSFHPLCAVSEPTADLSGHTVAVAASDPKLLATLRRMARALGMRSMEVAENRRAEYHAGAVMAAGLMVALLSSAVAALVDAGLSEEDALEALLPLTRSALDGAQQHGLKRGLTGPIARGDLAIVQAHLAALPAELASIYRVLSLRSLHLVADQLPPETRAALDRALRS